MFIVCVTLLIVVAIVCNCVKECHKIDNDVFNLEKENRDLRRRLLNELERKGYDSE